MSLSRQLKLLALINGIALLIAIALTAYRLAELRHAFGDYAKDQQVLYRLSGIKAAALATSRADLLAADTPALLEATGQLVSEGWTALKSEIPAELQQDAALQIVGNWSEFQKNFANAIKIFSSAPEDALSIPERIYPMYLLPLNQMVDKLLAARQEVARAHSDAISAQIDRLLWVVLTPLLAAGAMILVFQIRFGQRLRRRLAAMSAVAAQLEAGDLSRRLPEDQKDEIGDLARRFNRFIMSFEVILGEVKAVAQNVRNYAHEVAAKNAVLSEQSGEHSERLKDTRQTITGISAAIEDIAISAAEASASSIVVNHMSDEASGISTAAGAQLEVLSSAVGEASIQMSTLAASITQIGNVSSLIRDIANQTNLLALNAAIEAARAGEHGRGFAVVADEVRALSERTAFSTGKIEELLQQVWKSSAEVVESIAAAREKAESGREHGARVVSHLEEIVPAIDKVTRMLDGIASATDTHSTATAGIRELIAEASRFSAGVVDQLELAGEDLGTMVKVAGQLQLATERFRLSA